MKTKSLIANLTGLFLLSLAAATNAELITIGSANYDSNNDGITESYNLIWDNDNNGNSVVWLDYTNGSASLLAQKQWAAGLDDILTYNIDLEYIVNWDGNSWRLPDSRDGEFNWTYDGSGTLGYNNIDSEMGHLFFEELANLAYYDTLGNGPQPKWGLQKTGGFENLNSFWYWSRTTYAYDPNPNSYSSYNFDMLYGFQGIDSNERSLHGLAVRSGQVTIVSDPSTQDADGDGVIDAGDECLESEQGEVTNDKGCSITQICPCDDGWANHGRFVKCVAQTSEDFVFYGLISKEDRNYIVSEAAVSECGNIVK